MACPEIPSHIQLQAAAAIEHQYHVLLDSYIRVYKKHHAFIDAPSDVRLRAERALRDVQVAQAKAARSSELLRQMYTHADSMGTIETQAAMARTYVQSAKRNKSKLVQYGDTAELLLDAQGEMDDMLQDVGETFSESASAPVSSDVGVDGSLFEKLQADATAAKQGANLPFNSLSA
jgi:hypothetical protein